MTQEKNTLYSLVSNITKEFLKKENISIRDVTMSDLEWLNFFTYTLNDGSAIKSERIMYVKYNITLSVVWYPVLRSGHVLARNAVTHEVALFSVAEANL